MPMKILLQFRLEGIYWKDGRYNGIPHQKKVKEKFIKHLYDAMESFRLEHPTLCNDLELHADVAKFELEYEELRNE